ncbi:hypothetical protein IK5_05374 [Bacillus cereus VD154]|uniref:Uncharacterized protein n=1 Tax=Bacillus cereus VD154 TaxID=1053238 RepID=A0A9W5NZZ1_BACCE|nr:hypothetical protein IK5_05374 [Bacillus cereus VD154]
MVARLVTKADGIRGFVLEGDQSIFAKNHVGARKGCLQNEIIQTIEEEDTCLQ